ncbi:MAG: metal-dependent hydrolase [Chloroflexota bacterium]
MSGETHTIIGAAVGAWIAPPGDLYALAGCVFLGVMLAKAPDTLERPLGCDHRKATHSVWAVLIVCAAALWVCDAADVGRYYGWAAAGSYTAHILADMLTVSGVYLLAPVQRTRRAHLLPRGLRPRTGGAWDGLVWVAFGVWVFTLLLHILNLMV